MELDSNYIITVKTVYDPFKRIIIEVTDTDTGISEYLEATHELTTVGIVKCIKEVVEVVKCKVKIAHTLQKNKDVTLQ